jgi:capsular polysaccharide biosynthesis protein
MKLETDSSSFLSDNIAKMLWQNRKPIGIICALAFVCSVAVSFLIPPKYKASCTMFANLNNNNGHALFSELSDRDYMGFGEEKACEQMTQVLSSEAVMRAMIKKYDLMHYYKVDPEEPSKYALLRYYYSESFSFDITEYKSIRVDVSDKDPKMAAVFANGVVQIADSIYRQMMKERAIEAMKVIQLQYDSTNKEISRAEDSLNVFRKKGILDYNDQVKELTKGYSDAVIKGNPANVKQIEDKMATFGDYGKRYWYFEQKLTYYYRFLEELYQTYVETGTNMDNPSTPFFILDKAVAPDKKFSPVRWLIVLGGTFAGMIFGIFLLLLIKRFSKA